MPRMVARQRRRPAWLLDSAAAAAAAAVRTSMCASVSQGPTHKARSPRPCGRTHEQRRFSCVLRLHYPLMYLQKVHERMVSVRWDGREAHLAATASFVHHRVGQCLPAHFCGNRRLWRGAASKRQETQAGRRGCKRKCAVNLFHARAHAHTSPIRATWHSVAADQHADGATPPPPPPPRAGRNECLRPTRAGTMTALQQRWRGGREVGAGAGGHARRTCCPPTGRTWHRGTGCAIWRPSSTCCS